MKVKSDNIFFISDLHFGHANVIGYDNRPFDDVYHMHEELIYRWNSVVNNDSVVFYLGDLYMKLDDSEVKSILNRLNGTIHYVMGNHDKIQKIKSMNRFESISDILSILVKDEDSERKHQHIVMCHFPMLVWDGHHRGTWHLHGHCHHSIPKDADYYKRRVMDVGCNGIDYTPISYNSVKKIMAEKSINKIDHH